ncbi:MutS family DNA mismatch repair protein [Reichenbachiella sp.]|uniref:MutS family DNA mismatch repair protein n=1 Tax=Reichenbachiella sp. TaxID=2184521 RepID=UPI003B58E529
MTDKEENFYDSNLKDLKQKSAGLEHQVNRLSWIRVITFCVFIVSAVYFANAREIQLMLFSVLLFVPLFGWIVRKHNKFKFALAQHQFLITINENETKRVKGKLSDLDDGMEYLDPHHAYAPDLDLFGSNSLFQLLVRSKLSGTREYIKTWLLNKASKSEIEERQQAIQELSRDTSWRQNLTAYGYHGDQKNQQYTNVVISLVQWIDKNLSLIDNPIWSMLRYVMPAISLGVLIGINLFEWPYQWIYLPVLINLGLLSVIFKPLMEVTNEFGNIASFLKGYENVIVEIEQRKFNSPLLIRLHHQLITDHGSASRAIKGLRRILMFLLSRANFLYLPFNVLFLLDVNWLSMAISWKKKNINNVDKWFDAVHQIDALSDLSSYAFSNPSYSFPSISNENHFLSVGSMGHPLIKSEQRVSNDFNLSEIGKLGLVTGSNMSGKSTFLRTIGVNIVLAQMGAPVCAKKFECSPVQIFTSMRTQDNLEENVSSFYAELKRLKSLLNLLTQEEPVFYMLDEILKGTNSEDRHKGALSLIDQLIKQNCRGLISTHDIQLSALSKEHSNIQNMSFNSTIVDDEIIFDYKLSLEPCNSFNASKLMEKMGIIKK